MDQFDKMIETLVKDYKWLVVVLAIGIAPLVEEPIFKCCNPFGVGHEGGSNLLKSIALF
jgi:hypothetical protein